MNTINTKVAQVLQQADQISARNGLDAQSIKRGFANHLKYDLAEDQYTAGPMDRFLALAWSIRDRLIKGWVDSQQTHHRHRAKRVYYLSLEFLMGRAMINNLINLGVEKQARQAMEELDIDWSELVEQETDAGLGNGGLGRLAACFMDSLATMQIPAFGYGIRYDYGIFRQVIENGYQHEEPDDWLRDGNPWEVPRPDYRIPVHFGGRVERYLENGRPMFRWVETQTVVGTPYDMPIAGYRSGTVNTLRLWGARGTEEFDFEDFNRGDYIGAVEHKVTAENLTKVLYPNDNVYVGKELRLRQQYFFVACSLWDILRRFQRDSESWDELPNKVAIQLNDTHPALAVPELMRLLMDEHKLEWGKAWDLTVRTLAYTNHTLLPEALETWPVSMMERLLPRHLQIIYGINHYFLDDVARLYPDDYDRLRRMSLVDEHGEKRVRMAHLSIVGTHSTNGVAKIHSELLKKRLVPDFAEMYPDRFNSKTNGVTPRRWLRHCNPALAGLITEVIGEDWISDLGQLSRLKEMADDSAFRDRFREVKQHNKRQLAGYFARELGVQIDPNSMFDVQIKRMHEYKRQLLNALHIVMLYNRLLENPDADVVPRTFIFGGKAAPGYIMAKVIIKLINNIAAVVNRDPVSRDKLNVIFVPNYRVSLAERLFPASNLSEQISTAGMEASGTGNMKFMMNGALTIGTLDGANIEMMDEVGPENIFIFGLSADEVATTRETYNPREVYEANDEIRKALDLIFDGHFNKQEKGIFDPIRQLLMSTDYYLHLADLADYAATQQRVSQLYKQTQEWDRKAILNVACSGHFSSDRTIAEYAREIWHAVPVRVRGSLDMSDTIEQARAPRS